ncbi:GntP family gluconate:H+ symporter [Trueperella bonasi]|uniref:GntP family gluconate:H+ symporter n=1 Tax=Trueperella bonasi TaxID=312286 RepID=A0ABT9NFE9_9ACTO|nr:GntP family transporter [Trueperella bonasi]MDP9806109.1 GntP family gluconate:H+ symporter [Trueperella bonasi]
MNTGALLGIAIGAIIVLLFLVIKVKMSAFVAILLVAVGTALATGIPVEQVVPVMTEGMGNTLGSVMMVVGLGAMLGRLIEVAGGADALAHSFTRALGEKRVIGAVTAAAFVLGIPVFFDVGFIILAPIVFGFARVAKINPLKIGLPVGGVMLTVHVALPPHPGPVAAAGITGADVGLMLVLGLPICVLTGIVGYMAAKLVRTESISLLESPAMKAEDLTVRETVKETATAMTNRVKSIGAGTVVLLILLPILQIMLGTVGNMVLDEGSTAQRWLSMIGSSAIALLTGVIIAYLVIGSKMGWSLEKRGKVLDSALPDVAVIVFVTGAGGVFANVLVKSGIGTALADALISMNMPIILAGFLISSALRASQGSATVAILTAAGLLAEPIAAAGYSMTQNVLVTLAIAFGGLGLSHINDSGFWIVTKYLGLSVKDGLRTWTVLTTVFGVTGFLLTWLVFAFV